MSECKHEYNYLNRTKYCIKCGEYEHETTWIADLRAQIAAKDTEIERLKNELQNYPDPADAFEDCEERFTPKIKALQARVDALEVALRRPGHKHTHKCFNCGWSGYSIDRKTLSSLATCPICGKGVSSWASIEKTIAALAGEGKK